MRGWRQLRVEGRRYVTVALALSFGVALLFGTLLASQSVSRQISEDVKSLGGFADVSIAPKTPGVPIEESAVATVSHIPRVRMTVPTLSMHAAVRGGVTGGNDRTFTLTGYPTTPYNAMLANLGTTGRLPSADRDEALLPGDIAKNLASQSVTRSRYQVPLGQRNLPLLVLSRRNTWERSPTTPCMSIYERLRNSLRCRIRYRALRLFWTGRRHPSSGWPSMGPIYPPVFRRRNPPPCTQHSPRCSQRFLCCSLLRPA